MRLALTLTRNLQSKLGTSSSSNVATRAIITSRNYTILSNPNTNSNSQSFQNNNAAITNNLLTTNEDELYGDLDDAAVAKPQTNNVTKKNDATTIMSTSMSAQTMPTMMSQPEMIQLQQQIKSLKAENDTLKRNIGILYRTAKSELERKDRTIGQLQDEVDSLRR